MSKPYFFLLGNTPELSLLELNRFFPGQECLVVAEGIAQIDLPEDITPGELMLQLGGTIKIFSQMKQLSDDASNDEIEAAIKELLIDSHDDASKVSFAVAEFGRNHLDAITPVAIKKQLRTAGKKARYIEGPRYGISAAVLLHNQVTEIAVIKTETATILAKTEAVQDIDHWTVKDRSKPYASRKKGMLPPKVARMMVNMACGQQPHPEAALYDPFCGSGTVLLEAMERSLTVVGSDLDQDAVEGSRKNLQWFSEEFGFSSDFQVFHGDATTVQLSSKVQYLVTEPFLGKPKPSPEKIPNIFRGLEKMYLGAFKHWRSLLEPGATVVIVFPRALAATSGIKKDVTLDHLIDKLGSLGYTPILESVLYHRPQAVIGREIHIFEYQPAND